MVKKRVRDADKEVLPDAPIVDQDDSGSDEVSQTYIANRVADRVRT